MSDSIQFREAYREPLMEFLEIHRENPQIVDSLDILVEKTQPWVKGDHARPENRVGELDEATELRLHELHHAFDMKQEIALPPRAFEHVILPGSTMLGNERRTDFVQRMLNSGVEIGHLLLLGGERVPYPEAEGPHIERNIDQLEAMKDTISDPLVVEIADRKRDVVSETDMLRISVSRLLPELVFEGVDPITGVISYKSNDMRASITHTRAVARPQGSPRHTTEACMADVVKLFGGEINGDVGFVATNPHVLRMTRAAQDVVNILGRNTKSLRLIPGGPGGLDSYSFELYRGEVARSIWEDKLALEPDPINRRPNLPIGHI